MSESLPQLRVKTAYTALLLSAAEIVSRALTLLLSIFAARWLGPTEVGALGLAITLMAVVSIIGFFPETAAVVAGGRIDHRSLGVAATVLRALVISLVLGFGAAIAPMLTTYLTEGPHVSPKVGALLHVLLWVPLLEVASCYPQVRLQRHLDLPFLTLMQLLNALFFVGAGLVMLWLGYGTAGLAWSQVGATAAVVPLIWLRLGRLDKSEDRLWPSSETWGTILQGTLRLFAGRFLGFVVARSDNLLVAGTIGVTGMSFYSMAWNASRAPLNILEKVLSFALVPTISRIRNDPARLQRALDDSLGYSYLVITPIGAATLVAAPLLTSALLGSRWLPLVPCLQVMSLAAVAAPLLFLGSSLLVALGRAHLLGLASLSLLMFQIVAIPPAARRWGPLGAAWVDLAGVLVLTAGTCIATRSATDVAWRVRSAMGLPVLASGLAAALAWHAPAFGLQTRFGTLAIQLGILTLSYLVIVSILGGFDRLRDLFALLRHLRRQSAIA